MSTMKIKFYADPGHGWAAVKRKVLYDLGIAGQVTYYSYEKGNTVYLEEDHDLGLLIQALKDRGIGYSFVEKHTNRYSPIRNYNHYFA